MATGQHIDTTTIRRRGDSHGDTAAKRRETEATEPGRRRRTESSEPEQPTRRRRNAGSFDPAERRRRNAAPWAAVDEVSMPAAWAAQAQSAARPAADVLEGEEVSSPAAEPITLPSVEQRRERRRRNAAPESSPRRLVSVSSPEEESSLPEEAEEDWETAAAYLRAVARDIAPDHFGEPPRPVDDDARRLWKAAFGAVVRRRFDQGSPLAEITRTVTAAVRTYEVAAPPPLETEMLMRAELGETVPVEEIDPDVAVVVHLLMFAALVEELALVDDELDDLINQAEELAAAEV